MKVLSLFDGISRGRVALERAGIPVERYFSYEIEPSAIVISKNNYPDIIQCGDVFDTDFCTFAIQEIDLIMGGSPCTFWSKAKCHTAKQARELDTEGMGWKLFQKFAEAVHNVKPKYFLYENNYGMPPTIEAAISETLGVKPILIDSALVSAQRRKRLYWTNIPDIKQPTDREIYIKDIIVSDTSLIKQFDERMRKTLIKTSNYIKYDLGGKGHYSQQDRLYFLDGKAPTVPKSRTETKLNVYLGGEKYKKTCPIEAERLQTLPDNYTAGVPKTKRYEAIGNGWTVDVIAHILKQIKEVKG